MGYVLIYIMYTRTLPYEDILTLNKTKMKTLAHMDAHLGLGIHSSNNQSMLFTASLIVADWVWVPSGAMRIPLWIPSLVWFLRLWLFFVAEIIYSFSSSLFFVVFILLLFVGGGGL